MGVRPEVLLGVVVGLVTSGCGDVSSDETCSDLVGTVYQPGETRDTGCNYCTCQDGGRTWACTQEACSATFSAEEAGMGALCYPMCTEPAPVELLLEDMDCFVLRKVGNQQQGVLSRCENTPGGSADECFRLRLDWQADTEDTSDDVSAGCLAQGYNVEIVLDHMLIPQPDTTYTIGCETRLGVAHLLWACAPP